MTIKASGAPAPQPPVRPPNLPIPDHPDLAISTHSRETSPKNS